MCASRLAWLGLLVGLFGCPQEILPLADAGESDAEVRDADPVSDASPLDGSPPDGATLDATADATADGGPDDASATDAAALDGAIVDAGFTPNDPCEPVVLPCLDPARPEVLSVPDELTGAQALAMVRANQILQLRGGNVGAGVRVPPAVTFYGCEGATIDGTIAFEGIGGRVEGFEVSGAIVANQTGAYVVRRNRFIGTSPEPAVSARSVDALVSASVVIVVEQNLFTGRAIGVEVATRYDTMQHQVNAQIHDNIFDGTTAPIRISETGLVGRIDATIRHNTFHAFQDAIRIDASEQITAIDANLFAVGTRAIAGTSPYAITYALLDAVTTDAQTPPFSGTFARGEARFVDASAQDFRLLPPSDAIDLLPPGASSGLDNAGCVRPAALLGAAARADVGALEAQP